MVLHENIYYYYCTKGALGTSCYVGETERGKDP